MKQVAVLGLGDFGVSLAQQLKKNNVAVLAVDVSRDRVDLLRDEIDHVVVADISQALALQKLGLTSMDAVVVATSSPMPVSILAVLRLRELGVDRIIAKAENRDHAKVLLAMGVNEIVIPEEDSAVRIANKISWTNVVEMVELSSGYSIMEVSPPEATVGTSLRNSGLRHTYHVEVLGIREQAGALLKAIPSPDSRISAECTLVVFGENSDLAKLRRVAEQRKIQPANQAG